MGRLLIPLLEYSRMAQLYRHILPNTTLGGYNSFHLIGQADRTLEKRRGFRMTHWGRSLPR